MSKKVVLQCAHCGEHTEFVAQSQVAEAVDRPKRKVSPRGALPGLADDPLATAFLSDVTHTLQEGWLKAYPAWFVRAEIRKAQLWLTANPHRRRKRLGAFMNNWLARAADTQGARLKAPQAVADALVLAGVEDDLP